MAAFLCLAVALLSVALSSSESDDFYLPPTIPCWKDGTCMYDPGPCLPEDEPKGLHRVAGVKVSVLMKFINKWVVVNFATIYAAFSTRTSIKRKGKKIYS